MEKRQLKKGKQKLGNRKNGQQKIRQPENWATENWAMGILSNKKCVIVKSQHLCNHGQNGNRKFGQSKNGQR